MSGLYIAYSSAVPTTAVQAKTTTGTAIKTLLQLTAPANQRIKIISWGVSFDASAAATPGACELLGTGTVAGGTPTAVTPTLWDSGESAAQSTAGFAPATEGTITTTRLFDGQLVAPTSQYVREFSLGREPIIAASGVVRVRVHFAGSIGALAWIHWEE
jgi:hypothetical protein